MEYFPLGLAEGRAFCNRVSEREQLRANIEMNRSTIVTSPRRYGKSSLVLYVLESMKVPYKRVDLFVTVDESTVAREIVDGVNVLINQVIDKPDKVISLVKDIIKKVHTKWVIGTDGIHVELSRKGANEDSLAIRDALIILDKVLEKKDQKAVFFIDEFQEIGIVANAKGIEGAIRSVAEKSKNLTFVFSGSNRHVLSTMFDDRSRPLYMLCDRIVINRISAADYVPFIDKIAKKRWGKSLSESFYEELFNVTEYHPYYVNLVCGRLYMTTDSAPTQKSVSNVWGKYLLEEKSKVSIDLSKLSLVQKKVMILIANGQGKGLSAKETVMKLSVSSGSIAKSLKALVAKDYIYEDDEFGYRVLDPMVSSSIQKFFPSDELI